MPSFTLSWDYTIVGLVVVSLCVLVASGVVVGHIWFSFRGKQKNRVSQPPLKRAPTSPRLLKRIREDIHELILSYCTGLSLLCYYLMIGSSLVYRLSNMNLLGNWCADYVRFACALWTLGKCNMYLVFTARVHVAFCDSAYRYSEKTIIFLYIAVILLCSPPLVLLPSMFGGHTEDVTNKKWTVCVSDINIVILSYGFMADLFMASLLLTLFTRPLKKLFRRRNSQTGLSIDRIEMQLLPLKYAVTTAIAVLSTAISMVMVAATGVTLLTACDSTVNMLCLVIMTSRWKAVYWRMCAPLLRAIAYFDCCFDDALRGNLERILEHYASTGAAIERELVQSQSNVTGTAPTASLSP